MSDAYAAHLPWLAHDRLAALARDRGDDPALVEARGPAVSWAELDRRAGTTAALVTGQGVVPGDRVAILADPSADAVAAILGTLRVGAVAAPIPGGLTRRERAAAIRAVDPGLVLRVADLSGRPVGPAATDPSAGGTTDADGGSEAAGAPDPETPAVVVLTSGTTGDPRAVVLSHRALAASADSWLGALPPVTGWILALGLAHVAGLGVVWRAVRDGVPTRIVARDDAVALLESLHADPLPSHVSLVPTQLARLLDVAAGPPPGSLRAVLIGGGPIPPALVARAVTAGWPVVTTYGLSETASGATALPTVEARKHPGSAGRPLPGVGLAIADAGRDGIGEIVVRTTARSSGYLADLAAGVPPVAIDEPVRTGDLGRIDADGRLHVVDRRLDRIVRGGENVSPAEVEAVLLEHPAVLEVAVVGRSDEALGQVPVAAIRLRDGAVVEDGALAAHARASLAGFKVPVGFTRVDALPRTPGGKLRREAVRALLAGEPEGGLARPGGDAIGWRMTGSGRCPLLLLPGTLSTARQLDRLAGALAGGERTIHAIDRRGSGASRLADPRPLDIAVHVADLVAYLDARSIDRADVAGVSFGGVLAIELAARHPERVRAVVAYEPPYGAVADPDTLAWFRRLAADTARAHAARGPAGAAETFLRAVAGDEAWERLPARARRFLEAEGDGALVDAGLTGLDVDDLVHVVCPVTILTGAASDAFYIPIADALARRIPGARRATLDDLTHTSPITQPGLVADAMLGALEPCP